MPKPEREFFDVTAVPWTPTDRRVLGMTERILTASGDGFHPFWEEVYILEGAPPMRHGPWETPGGCLTFEVRYATLT